MDPLQTLLKPLTILINRQIRVTTPARELCEELDGRVIAIRVSGSALSAYFQVHRDRMDLSGRYEEEPDVVITGSLLSLARLATPDATQAIRDGSVELHGDARTAQSFQRLLQYGKPDLEEELSALIGDSAAQGLSDLGRKLRTWGEGAGQVMRQNISEYLQEESRAVPSRDEVETFRRGVDELRDDVARFEARLRRAESKRTETD